MAAINMFLSVLKVYANASGGEIFVLDMGEPSKIHNIAHNMIELAGLRPDIDIEFKEIGLCSGEKLIKMAYSDEEPEVVQKIRESLPMFKGAGDECRGDATALSLSEVADFNTFLLSQRLLIM